MNHTPGLWKPELLGDYYRVVTEHGASGGYMGDVMLVGNRDNPRSLANANLIAAAPDLLQACRAMVSDDAFADLCAGIGEKPEWLSLAKAAIAKAEGKL